MGADGDGTTPADIPIDATTPLSAPLQLISQVTEAPPGDEDPVTGWFSVVVICLHPEIEDKKPQFQHNLYQ
eukprot:951406-Rhodomonas_salina.6